VRHRAHALDAVPSPCDRRSGPVAPLCPLAFCPGTGTSNGSSTGAGSGARTGQRRSPYKCGGPCGPSCSLGRCS
jgi:hypothetical protein